MSLLIGALTIGLILSLLALGMFISFKIYNFADITAEGSITLGASITAALIVSGMNPVSATLIAMAGGFVAGTLTGIIHTKFNINGLLAGILMMTALYSVNLHIMGKSNLPLMSQQTLISLAGDISFIPDNDTAVLVVILAFVAIIGIALYLFFRTNLGTAMRATGNNPQMIRALGVNTGLMITLGLGMANALIALSGAILAQYQGFADVQMGIGMMVWGLASVIIGEAIIGGGSVGMLIIGSIMGSEITAAVISDKLGQVRRDPFAMLPFIGYHVCDYLQHWFDIGTKTTQDKLPKIYYVNWFRKDADGRWLWPGFGENSRVLKWIVERVAGTGKAVKTPIGMMPTADAIDVEGLDVSAHDMEELLKVSNEEWLKEVESIRKHYAGYGAKLPKELAHQLEALEARLKA